MFLKEIHIEGFKSFAKKSIIKFDDGLVGFVGPNGSGKSNINDAIRWALGEKSFKKLRGSTNDDVIFAGSPTLPKSKFAEVSLVFDNTEKLLNTEYSTVKVTRRVFRNSGENEYLINKNNVRLKEIRNLILDTGLGNSALSIISQGTISKMAEAKPREVRSLLDEAAGVSKYQITKSDAIRKLDRVQQNLEIIEVTYNELKRQVKPLLNQSEKAIKYIKLKEELEKIELSLITKELKESSASETVHHEDFTKLSLERDIRKTKIEKIEKSIEAIDRKNIEIDRELNDLQRRQVSIQEKINNLKTKAEINNDRTNKEEYKKELEGLISSYRTSKNRLNTIEQKVSDFNEQISSHKNSTSIVETEVSKLKNMQMRIEMHIENLKNDQEKSNLTTDETINYVIENKSMFPGILGTVSDFIDVKKIKSEWLLEIFNNNMNKLIVNNEETARDIINFLREEKKGKIEIIPQDNYVGNPISGENEIILSNLPGYEGTLLKYFDVHETQLSGLITKYIEDSFVFDTYEQAKNASKLIKSSHSIISQDGYIINDGYTVYGGTIDATVIDNKEAIEAKENDLTNTSSQIKEREEKLADLKVSFESLIKESSFEKQNLNNLMKQISEIENKISLLKSEYSNKFGEDINVSDSNLVETVESSKDVLLSELVETNTRINFLNESKLENNESIIKDKKDAKELSTELFELIEKVQIASSLREKTETEFSRNIEILNQDYKLTYDALMKQNLVLNVSVEEARIEVNKLRYEIEKLGYINLESVENYKLVSDRYDEVKESFEDIKQSRADLLKSISTLDKKMIIKFKDMFEKVNVEFNKIYSSTFNGGMAKIEYSDPENILETGVDIIVKPKNKSITNLSLFSGGEKAMISLAFIFAILSVKKIPFLIMDEAEAPLDESNVERYGNFCRELNKKTQVMLVTHRPGTMELCDSLYGVTMEGNAGVTKIVSVKLSEAKNYAGE